MHWARTHTALLTVGGEDKSSLNYSLNLSYKVNNQAKTKKTSTVSGALVKPAIPFFVENSFRWT